MACFKVLCLAACLLFLAACQSLPNFKSSKAREPEPSLENVEPQGELAPLELIPNPYQGNASVPPQALADFNVALQHMNAQQWTQANTLLLGMTQTYPELSGTYVNLGLVYRALDEPEKSIEAFKTAIEKNRKNTDAYSQLGLALREQGEFEQAEQIYLQALDVWPHDPKSLRGLGILYDLYMGKLSQALAQYRLLSRVLNNDDKALKGWIVDLERRVPKTEVTAETEPTNAEQDSKQDEGESNSDQNRETSEPIQESESV